MEDFKENVIEWITGSDTISITDTDRALQKKIKAIRDEYPEEVKSYVENADGSIYMRISKNCIRIGAKKKYALSDEEKESRRQRLAQARANKEGD